MLEKGRLSLFWSYVYFVFVNCGKDIRIKYVYFLSWVDCFEEILKMYRNINK